MKCHICGTDNKMNSCSHYDKTMATDTQKTNVLFLIEKPEGNLQCDVFAFFKDEQYNSFEKDVKLGYAHIGQHTGVHIDYANECKQAIKE